MQEELKILELWQTVTPPVTPEDSTKRCLLRFYECLSPTCYSGSLYKLAPGAVLTRKSGETPMKPRPWVGTTQGGRRAEAGPWSLW